MEVREEKTEVKQFNKTGQEYNRFFLITYPRSASNLLVRMLALDKQPNVVTGKNGGYFFLQHISQMNQLKLRTKHVEEWTQAERDQAKQSYQDAFDNLDKHVQTARREGKVLFVKEHAYFMTEPTAVARFRHGEDSVTEKPWTVQVPATYAAEEATAARSQLNETVLPDAFLKTWLPTFLIRHPALAFPSHYRTILDNDRSQAVKTDEERHGVAMTLHWTRTLYDFFTDHFTKLVSPSDDDDDDDDDNVKWPLVLDADDIMTSPDLVLRFSQIIGLDPHKVQFTWTPASEQELAKISDAIERRMLSTVLTSSGILKGKTSADLDIAAEAEKWRREFGEREGGRLEQRVRDAMPDYEYMKAKRLRPKADGKASAI